MERGLVLAFLYFAGDNSTFSNQGWSHKMSKGAISESVRFTMRIFYEVLYKKYVHFQTEADAKREAELFSRRHINEVNADGQIERNFPKIIQTAVDGCHVNCELLELKIVLSLYDINID